MKGIPWLFVLCLIAATVAGVVDVSRAHPATKALAWWVFGWLSGVLFVCAVISYGFWGRDG